ncbi:4Fe-4S binding protein [Shewanella corallii]|uniref:4Fe-4S binding protein n=1 Tax=Shewanella corallii TaxID=560080 RepID=A0ABT0NA07_9GAMM|nr:4Fe-4S binding protein [Shewanella corallii]MCL2915294.1 4Fe-4S binding protein [Shewanella corallii]
MTLIESFTLMLALVYIASQLFWGGHQYGALVATSTLVAAVAVSMSPMLLLGLLLASLSLMALKFAKPELFVSEIRINPLRYWLQHLLALSILLTAIHYTVYHLLLAHYGDTGVMLRPNVLDAFLPIAGGIELRAITQFGYFDIQHPAAVVMLAAVLLTGLLCKRAFCGWACPLGLAGEYLYKLRTRLIPGEYNPPAWLDWPLRMIKYLLLAFLLYVVIGMPAQMLPHYLGGEYHKVADLKMATFFTSPGTITLICFAVILLLAAWRKQAFCRYLCPYGAALGLLSLASPLKIRRNPQECVKVAKGTPCSKCTRACPAGIKVDELTTVHSDECQACLRCVAACPRKEALALGLANGKRLSHRGLAITLLIILFALPMLAYLLGYWESQTPEAMRLYLMQHLDKIGI